MKRRNFIMLTTAGVVAAGSSYAYLTYFNNGRDNNPIGVPQSLSAILDAGTIREIGEAYRQRFPKEAEEHDLLKLLGVATAQETVDRSILKKMIAKDFETWNTEIVNGWVLSLTEVRQCALFSLQKNK